MISERPCGVDVQIYTDTVRRIADRFLTDEDLSTVNQSENKLQYFAFVLGCQGVSLQGLWETETRISRTPFHF